MWLQDQWRLRPLIKVEAVEQVVRGGVPGCQAAKVIPRLDELQHGRMLGEGVAGCQERLRQGNYGRSPEAAKATTNETRNETLNRLCRS